MKVVFTEKHETSLDGINPVTFLLDEVAELTEEKAALYVERGVAQYAPEEADKVQTKVIAPLETKPADISKLNRKDIAALGKKEYGIVLDPEAPKPDLLEAMAKAKAEKEEADKVQA